MNILMLYSDGEDYYDTAISIAVENDFNAYRAHSIEDALHLLAKKVIDILMIDVNMDVKKLISVLYNERICIKIIACGYDNNHRKIVRAIKSGAEEYIHLPPDTNAMIDILNTLIDKSISTTFPYLSPKMKDILLIVEKISHSNATILITGESGTGKEVISRLIHKKSPRSEKPLISVNCAAIPSQLMESELFGHEKGSFTGALTQRIGKFEASNNGTILLDEISEMDTNLQAKLLRVLQEKEITRIGSNKNIKVDMRVIATSNRDLNTEIKKGNFREDLFFRLNVININLPPLRERKEDIENLAKMFIKKFCILNGYNIKNISSKAVYKLLSYSWPGNIRELENTIHRSVLLSSIATINDNDIIIDESRQISKNKENNSETIVPVGNTIDRMERDLINKTISHCEGNKTKAAQILGISIRTLRNKLNSYQI